MMQERERANMICKREGRHEREIIPNIRGDIVSGVKEAAQFLKNYQWRTGSRCGRTTT